ncbi:MAG: NADH:flavin oxidoreductase [Planctomycetes bacterium]|nr:NADH:flavin oxidoreductase [Planctomycetota bacterium]MBL7037622.1 NADH:flavin oxidoreductase [Pirellulaceae bacterium]
MPEPFETTSLGGVTLKNRFVRSATWEGMAAEDGTCTAEVAAVVTELAKSEVGLIISSHAYISPEGQASPRQVAVYSDRFVVGLKQMADAAHNHGSSIVLQLAHAGVQAATPLTKMDAIGPTAAVGRSGAAGRVMTEEEIDATISAFVDAAGRARDAGFDGVQLHAAHGYLLSQFLSPYFNRRTDQYGGSTKNRARIVLSILERIRNSLGDAYPVLIKMNSEDFLDGGLQVEEMLLIAAMLAEAGIAGIEMSGGTIDPAGYQIPVRKKTPVTEDEEVYYRDAARQFKETIRVPLILVGGIRSYEVAKELIQDRVADYIALSRPLIREPHLVARWRSGDIRTSECESCNGCFGPIFRGRGIYCVRTKAENSGGTT